jgi:hypothetical protein
MDQSTQVHSPQAERGTAPQLSVFLALQVFLVLACAAAEVFANFVLHLTGAYIYPLKTRSQTAWDFTLFANKFRHFGRPDFFQTDPGIPFPYPAPLAVAYKVFYTYQAHPLRFFLGFIVATFALAGILLCVALHRRGLAWAKASAFVLTTLLLAYPLWYELKQGNIEICVWLLIATGVWAFCKGRGYAAATCFGIAGSMKIIPFIFLGLLLTARRYREIAFAGLAAIVTTVLSLSLVGPGILNTWRSVQESLATFRLIYILHLRSEEIGFDHSLFAIYKRFYHPLPSPGPLGHIADVYLAVAALCGIGLYILRIRHLPIINQVLCLTVASILLPPISFDYTLLQLYVPWAMLALFAQEQWQARRVMQQNTHGLTAAFVCMAVLMSPESEFIWHSSHFGGQIKALVLVVLMGIGLKYPFTPSAEEARQMAEFQPEAALQVV